MKPFQIRFKKLAQVAQPGEFANAIITFHRAPCDARDMRFMGQKKAEIRFRYAVDVDLWLVQFRVSFMGRWGFWNPNGRFLWQK